MITYTDYLKLEQGNFESIGNHIIYQNATIMKSCVDQQQIIKDLEKCIVLNIRRDVSVDDIEIFSTEDMKIVNIEVKGELPDKLEEYINQCKNIQCLSIENGIEIIDAFFKMHSLKYLFIRNCKVDYKMPKIYEMTSLKILSLNNTDVTYISSEISNLVELEALSVMNTRIRELPKELSKVSKIRYLGMNGTGISNVPSVVQELPKLESLYLGKTKIKELPDEMQNLTEMIYLALWETDLEELPEWICGFRKLKGLYLGRTKKLKTLPEKIGELLNLEKLYIDGTGITELPNSFSNLINLKEILLKDTQIQKFPVLNEMNKLIKCDLSGMVLEKIPKEFINSKININVDKNNSEGLCLYNTKLLCQPISLFTHSKEFISAYFQEEKIHLNESKIVFLGDGESGKSHIIRRIQEEGQIVNTIEYQATPGIDIVPKQCKIGDEQINLQLWDFGGQDILHSMHRFFLTDRTLYVIVINARDNTQNERARYWLNNVKSFANGCPVILILNKMDQNPSAGFNETLLKNDYPQIKEILKMSALQDEKSRFDNLVKKIFEVVKTFDSYAMEFPVSWNNIKTSLTAMRENYVVDETYRLLCQENGVDDVNIQNWLLEWFHDLGVSFNYRKKDILLGGYMVLM